MPKSKKNIIGIKYGRWIVVKEVEQGNNFARRFLCKCNCGNYSIVLFSSLISGKSTSCGCYKKEENIMRLSKPGRSINKKHTREYNSWSQMIQRCTNPNHDRYKNYGGRGISICDKWLKSFDEFLLDMGNAPSNHYSIDRIDVNGNYEPSNCRWATLTEQYRNMTTNRFVELYGVKMIISDFCKIVNKPLSAINWHIKNGKTINSIYEYYELKRERNAS